MSLSHDAFIQGMAILLEAFARDREPQSRIDLFEQMLSDLSDEEFHRAVKVCITTQRFYPSIAHLREAARQAPAARDIGQLFAKVELRILMGSSFRQIEEEFGPVVIAAVGAVGLEDFRRLDQGTNRPFAFRRFLEAMAETHAELANEQIVGPQPDRLANLVKQTGKVLAFPTRKTSPTRGIAS